MTMKSSYRYLFIGLLSGIFLSGLFLLLFSSLRDQNKPTYSLSSSSEYAIIPSEGDNLNELSVGARININIATLSELVGLPGIGTSKASAIIDFREKYGSFESTSELRYVPGIGESLLESLQDMITIGNE